MAGVHNDGTRSRPRLDIAGLLKEFDPSEEMLIGTKILPIVPSKTKDGEYQALTRETILGASNDRLAMAKGSAYDRKGATLTPVTYNCKKYGQEFLIPIEDSAEYSDQANIVSELAEINYTQLLKDHEKRVAAKTFDTSVWTGASLFTNNSSNAWSTIGTNILAQVEAAIAKVRTGTGMKPKFLILSYAQVTNLRNNTAIKAAVQYTAGGLLPEAALIEMLSSYFGLQMLIGDGIKNTAKEGQPVSATDIWSNRYAMVAVLPEEGSLVKPGIGRTFLWEQPGANPVYADSYYEDQTESDVIRVKHYTDEKIIDAAFGHLMQIET